MKKRILPLMILFIGIIGLVFSFPTLQTSAKLGDDYFEDFEGPVIPDWTVTGLWHVEDNLTSYWPIYTWIPSESHYMWYADNTSTSGTYDTGSANSGILTSDPIDLTFFEGEVRLGFYSWAQTENSTEYDLKWVEISPDGGTSWEFLEYIPDTSDWEYFSFYITKYGYSSNVRVRFIFDTVDATENAYFGWRLDNIEIVEESGYLDLNIYQGSNALVNETTYTDFEIWSHFNHDRDFNITITITSPTDENITLFNDAYITIYRLGRWFYSIEYTFTKEGPYRVIFEVEDYSGGYWWDECYWEIGPYLQLWIEQGYHALQYENREMKFCIKNHYAEELCLNVAAMIYTPSESYEPLIEETELYISAYGEWQTNFWYTFYEEGDYQVLFGAVDQYSRTWLVECWWQIGPYYDMWIDQEWEAHPGQTKTMDFYVDSFFDYDTHVNVSIIMYTPSGTEEVLYEVTNLYIPAWDSWSHSLYYTFAHPGKYNVQLLLVDETDEWWEYWCCWEVWEKFELWIEQDNHANINDEKWMDFHVKSYFNHTMEVKILIEITKPNGDVENLYEEYPISIDAYGSWDYSTSYIFDQSGKYKVLFTLVDDIEKEWIANCRWDIEGDGTDDDDDDDGMISPSFEGISLVLAVFTITLVFKKRK